MKISKNLREIVLAIGIILIVLRLYFPVKEYKIISDGNRISPQTIIDRYDEDRLKEYEKTVAVSNTIFQSIGIALLTGGFILIYNLKMKQNS